MYHSLELKASLFDYQPGRGREGPNSILEKYQGFLQTDGYSIYEKIGAKQGVVHLGCMAHARRHFMEARQSDVPLTDHALKMFQQLYAIEARIKDLALEGADKLRLRTDEAVPILKAMKKMVNRRICNTKANKCDSQSHGVQPSPYGHVNHLHHGCPAEYRQQSCRCDL